MWHRGDYKTNSNSVAAFDETGAQIGIVLETASPLDKPRLMTELLAWVNEEWAAARLHPLMITLCSWSFSSRSISSNTATDGSLEC